MMAAGGARDDGEDDEAGGDRVVGGGRQDCYGRRNRDRSRSGSSSFHHLFDHSLNIQSVPFGSGRAATSTTIDMQGES